jgi:23S rRNA (pseudouridine1915-N3)-methyltransferase
MRLLVVCVGRSKASAERDLVARYLERASGLSRNLGIDPIELREVETSRAQSAEKRKAQEAQAIRTALGNDAFVIACDEHGKNLNSEDWTAWLARIRDQGHATLGLVIGGPDGLDQSLCAQAALCLAYGAMTWPHQLVRVMAAEQIYRAMTILAGHPYHRS